MSEQKRYTAQEMREMADKLDGENSEYAICYHDKQEGEWQPLWKKPNSAVLALRQAADAEEELTTLKGDRNGILKANESLANDNDRLHGELAQLKARLEAVVKECERVRHIGETIIGEKVLTYDPRNHEIADAILRAARGEGGAE